MVWNSYYHREEPDPLDLPAVFAATILGLCAVVAQHCVAHRFLFRSLAEPQGRPSGPFANLLVGRLRRLIRRFDRLLVRFRAGKLAAPAGRRNPGARERCRPEPPPRLPSGHAWLVHLIAWKAAATGSHLQHLLATNSEIATLIEAAPKQMGRILRPLSRMLGFPLPPALLPTPRQRQRQRHLTNRPQFEQAPDPTHFARRRFGCEADRPGLGVGSGPVSRPTAESVPDHQTAQEASLCGPAANSA